MTPEVLQRLMATCGELVAMDLTRLGPYLFESRTEDVYKSLAAKRIPRVSGNVAIIPVHGVLSQYGGWYSQGMDRIYQLTRACVENSDIGGVVLNFDTPGGTSHGCMENAAKIRELSESKPIIGIANSLACSAGYWLLSSCSTVVASPGSDVGSIGVYVLYQNWQKALEDAGVGVKILRAGEHKIEMNPFEEMTGEIEARAMVGIEECYREFTSAVAEYRGITRAKVLSDFGKGLTFGAKNAAEIGLVDKVMDLETLLTTMTKSGIKGSRKASDAELTEWLCGVTERKQAEPEEYRASVDVLMRRLKLRQRKASESLH